MLDYLPSTSEDRGSIPSSKTSKKKKRKRRTRKKRGMEEEEGMEEGEEERNLFPAMLLFLPGFWETSYSSEVGLIV